MSSHLSALSELLLHTRTTGCLCELFLTQSPPQYSNTDVRSIWQRRKLKLWETNCPQVTLSKCWNWDSKSCLPDSRVVAFSDGPFLMGPAAALYSTADDRNLQFYSIPVSFCFEVLFYIFSFSPCALSFCFESLIRFITTNPKQQRAKLLTLRGW